MRFSEKCRRALSPLLNARQFHSSLPVARRTLLGAPQEAEATSSMTTPDLDGYSQLDDGMFSPKDADTTNLGHMMWQVQRQHLYYMRLIEHEMPKLVAFRKPFVPPTSFTPIVVRSIDYGGETHPATVKRSIVVPVARLPLRDEDAIHKIKLLAGVRWTPEPPTNAGVGGDNASKEHGFIHISCEDFPKPAMNLKWASDALDRLICQANDPKDKFRDVPLDTRHLDAKVRKAKRGDHARGFVGPRPSIKDFPKEWLPTPQDKPAVPVVSSTQ